MRWSMLCWRSHGLDGAMCGEVTESVESGPLPGGRPAVGFIVKINDLVAESPGTVSEHEW
jgi:hypothetical protein